MAQPTTPAANTTVSSPAVPPEQAGPRSLPRTPVIRRLVDAGNAHDLDALVACFTDDVVSRTPAHPSRSFEGSEQIRRNWGAIFAAVPDMTQTVVGEAIDDDTVWCEFAFDGTRGDGVSHHMRGVVIFGLRDDRIASVGFYMEPVTDDGAGPDEAVRRALASATASNAIAR